ncbi:hypothetical protein J3F84DRAFT_131119 [Trichoderma pleuroticola]
MIPSNEHPMSVTEACVCRRIKHNFLFGIRCLCTVITLPLAPSANAGRTYAYSSLRLMPSLSRYANMEVSCLLHLYQYDDATWMRPIHIPAACVPGRVPVATDPCLQASSFCRQVRDTAQLAPGTNFMYCIMHRARRRGGRVFVGFSRDANLPVRPPPARVSG